MVDPNVYIWISLEEQVGFFQQIMSVLEDNCSCFSSPLCSKTHWEANQFLPILFSSPADLCHVFFSFLVFVNPFCFSWKSLPLCPGLQNPSWLPLTCLTPVYPSGLSPGRFLWPHLLPTPRQHAESPVPFHSALCLPSIPLAGSQSTRKFLRTKIITPVHVQCPGPRKVPFSLWIRTVVGLWTICSISH